jgi:hypothetical protein
VVYVEENVPAQQQKKEEQARVSCPHGNRRWPQNAESSPGEKARTRVGLIEDPFKSFQGCQFSAKLRE